MDRKRLWISPSQISDAGGTASQKAAIIFQQYSVLIPIGFGYVVCILAFWAVTRIYLIHDVWRRVAESVTAHDLAAADNVVAQGKLVGALGEGFADSLDVVGF